MGVIVQEVVGHRFRDRFYPAVSGVARSYNYYPIGACRREDGVAHLALGLGKTIMDGGNSWFCCPSFPPHPAPLQQLARAGQEHADPLLGGEPGTPTGVRPHQGERVPGAWGSARGGSRRQSGRPVFDLGPGLRSPGHGPVRRRSAHPGFFPLLQGGVAPLAELIVELLAAARERLAGEVEIEFPWLWTRRGSAPRFGFLQVRPMAVRRQAVSLDGIPPERVLVRSPLVIGEGEVVGIRHVVYVKPGSFAAEATPAIATELSGVNARLGSTPYLLIGFGRWGSADPWLGIPVVWSQISGARAIVEGALPQMSPEPSQGSHFFHNLSGLGIPYFTVSDPGGISLGGAGADAGGRGPGLRPPRRKPRSAARPGGRGLRARSDRAMNPTGEMEQQEWKKLLNDWNRAGQGAGLPVPGGGDIEKPGGRPSAGHTEPFPAGDSPRLAIPPDLPRPRQPRGPRVHRRAVPAHPLAAERRGAGRPERRPHRGLLSGTGSFPAGGAEAAGLCRRPVRAFPVPAEAAPGGRRVGQRPPGPGARAQAMGDHHRAAGPDRPAPFGPDRPQDAQLPGLERDRGGPAPAGRLQPAEGQRPGRGAGGRPVPAARPT